MGCRAAYAPLPDQIIYFSILRLADYRPETFRSVINCQAPFLTLLTLEYRCKCRGLGPRVDALWLELRSSGQARLSLSTERVLLHHRRSGCRKVVRRTRRARMALQSLCSLAGGSYQRSLDVVGGDKGLWGLLLCCKYLVHWILTEKLTIGMFAGFVVLRIIIFNS